MFETLAAKTFFILSLSLFVAYIGNLLAVNMMTARLRQGNIAGAKSLQITALVIQVIAFIALMFLQHRTPLNMLLMFAFTLSSGFTLGIFTINRADVARKAVLLTGLITLATGLIATYSGLDFAWMGKFLFIALIILVIVSIIRLFVNIERGQRFFAMAGVIIFTGYLIFDFNRLAKAQQIAAANTWETALNFSISIYLDIINLLISLMNLMSASSN